MCRHWVPRDLETVKIKRVKKLKIKKKKKWKKYLVSEISSVMDETRVDSYIQLNIQKCNTDLNKGAKEMVRNQSSEEVN